MNKQYAPRYILSVFGVIALLLVWSWDLNTAHADTGISTTPQVSINGNGQTVVKNAKVVSISGDVVVAETQWGSVDLSWTVQTSGSTKFYPEESSKSVVHAIRVGDLISFTGEMNTSLAHPTVIASVLRDASLLEEGAIIHGTVVSVDLRDGTVTLKDGKATTTLAVGSGTIITRDGDPVSIGQIEVGNTIKAFGTLNLVDHTMAASKITYSTTTADSGAVQPNVGGGFFATILRWLRGSGGLMTIK